MANNTANYGLHQWEPGDSFLRTDFNEDLFKIDAALAGLHGRAEALEQALAPVNYNVYNLLLQNYYESKYTGYKRALLFDGFLDRSGIAGLTQGLIHQDQTLVLCGKGQNSFSSDYGNEAKVALSGGGTSRSFTAAGAGVLTRIFFYAATTNGNANPCTVTFGESQGGTLFTTSVTIQADKQYGIETGEVALKAGVTYVLAFGKCSVGIGCSDPLKRAAGYSLIITPVPAERGTMTAVSQPVEAAGRTALAWVRHSGGAAGLTLNGGEMEVVERREAQSLQGDPCTETALRLEAVPAAPDGTLTVTLEAAVQNADMTVYDYGVALL